METPFVKNYFDGKISHGFVSLYTGKTIVMIASGLLGIFLPIFIYNLFSQSFKYTALYFAIGYFLYIAALFFGVRFLNKFGFRRALRTSVFLGALYYVLFYFVDKDNLFYIIPVILLVHLGFRMLYWVPYHVDFAKFTSKKNRGRQIGAIGATRETLGVFMPLLAGFIISRTGFDSLFIIAIILFLVSGIPYLTIPHTQEKFRWSYAETFRNFFSKKYRKEMTAFASDGIETTAMFVIWPIFIFQLLQGDYLKVGFVSSFIIAASVILQLALGKKIDKTGRKKNVLRFGSVFSSASWIIKIFIETAFQIFVAGAFHNLMRIFTRTPFETLTYEIAADQGHYVDEFTVLREIAINSSRVLFLIFAAVISMYMPIQYLFVLAAAASILLNLLRPQIPLADF